MARYLLQQKTLRTLTKYFAVPAARGSCCIASSSAARVPVSALLQKKQDFFTHSKIPNSSIQVQCTNKICINHISFPSTVPFDTAAASYQQNDTALQTRTFLNLFNSVAHFNHSCDGNSFEFFVM